MGGVHEVLGMMSLNLHITESGYIFKTFLQDHLFEPSLSMSIYGLVCVCVCMCVRVNI